MARLSFNLAQAVSKIILSDSEENDEIYSADDIVSCHNDRDSYCEYHISENDQSGDNSSSGGSDENSDIEPKTELSMRTSKDGLIWTDRASGWGQRSACNPHCACLFLLSITLQDI